METDHFLYAIATIYVISILVVTIRAAALKTIYIHSPVILIDLGFFNFVLFPYLVLSQSIWFHPMFGWVVLCCTLINLTFLIWKRAENYKVIPFGDAESHGEYNIRWFALAFLLLVMLGYGAISGVSIRLLTGQDIEGYRRTAEVGLGVIKEIPLLGIKILFLAITLSYPKKHWRKVFVYSFGIGAFLFICTGQKADAAEIWMIPIIFLLLKYRGMRLYEFALFYFSAPIIAGLLQTVRGGLNPSRLFDSFFHALTYPFMIFATNVHLAINGIHQTDYVWGEEYWSGLVKIIPRFIWPDKPMSFDYRYKELAGLDFAGGGAPLPTSFSLYANFGLWFPIFYIAWVWSFYFFYRKGLSPNIHFSTRILLLCFLPRYSMIANNLGQLEVFGLFAFIFAVIQICLFRRQRVTVV